MKESEAEKIAAIGRELSDFSKRAFNRGLVGGTGGNMSARVPGTDEVLITPTGVSLGDVDPEIYIRVNLDGSVISAPPGHRPSKETGFHLAVYRLRPDVMAISHVHPPYATAFANKGRPLPLVTVSARMNLKEVPCIECALAGSSELCDFVTEGINKYVNVKALLMKEHGILVLGQDLKTAFYLSDLIEDTAKIAYFAMHIP